MGESTKKREIANYTGSIIYVGLDIHKKRWVVSIIHLNQHLVTFSMDPSPEQLARKLGRDYPGAQYNSVYEAGFCGFWVHRRLLELGIENIVINPADVPTTHKERRSKSDKVDSYKLARELAACSLKAIYVPSCRAENLRAMYRLRKQTVKKQTGAKQRIKAFLAIQGITVLSHKELNHWSKNFLRYLRTIEFQDPIAKQVFDEYLARLETVRSELARIEQTLRRLRKEHEPLDKLCRLLSTVSGIGFVLSMALAMEIIDMRRFSSLDKLACYVGLVPSITGSGEKNTVHGITHRKQRFLRYLLIEAAWVAISKDIALRQKFIKLGGGLNPNKAIIRIAKILLSRIRHVWLHEEPYVIGVIA